MAGGKVNTKSTKLRHSLVPVQSAKSDDDYRAEDDHRTMMRAEEVRGDHHRMRGVGKIHQRESTRMQKLGRSLSKGRRKSRSSSGKSR